MAMDLEHIEIETCRHTPAAPPESTSTSSSQKKLLGPFDQAAEAAKRRKLTPVQSNETARNITRYIVLSMQPLSTIKDVNFRWFTVMSTAPIDFATATLFERQVFYLADEGLAQGKGPNTVISLVHHYLRYYGFGKTNAKFHFDNCSLQNKNNAVVWYALWRVMIGLHQTILYSLMVAGHTKFSPDMHFGIWKNRWRRVDAETIEAVAKSVTESSKNGHNVSHVASDVVFYNWKIFLGNLFQPLKNLSKYRSFKVSHTEPGVVICKEYADSDEQKCF